MSSSRTLITLSVVEIVALVAVLAFFLLVLTKMLRQVAGNLHSVSCGVQSIEGHLTILAAVVMRVRGELIRSPRGRRDGELPS